MTYDSILYERDGDDNFATIAINRPAKLNAMDKTVIREMDDAVTRAVADPEVNALLLRGVGRAFSAGYDMQGGDFDVGVDVWREDMMENCEALLNIWRAPIPTVAAVHGYALAGAMELMMVCDLAIAGESCKFGEPEVRHNSGPPSLMMPWLIPTRHVRWLMYTGDLIDAAEALRIHLVNRVVPDEELLPAATKLMRKLARMPVPAIKYAKASINYQQRLAGMLDSWQYNVEAIAALHSTRAGRDWLAKLATMSLREYLAYRDGPFEGLDI